MTARLWRLQNFLVLADPAELLLEGLIGTRPRNRPWAQIYQHVAERDEIVSSTQAFDVKKQHTQALEGVLAREDEVAFEMADIFIYLTRLATKLDIDLLQYVEDKIKINEEKYPADKVKGSAKKYNQYD